MVGSRVGVGPDWGPDALAAMTGWVATGAPPPTASTPFWNLTPANAVVVPLASPASETIMLDNLKIAVPWAPALALPWKVISIPLPDGPPDKAGTPITASPV